jgi:hypothetical protein
VWGMMVAEKDSELMQFSLFPKATEEEIEHTKTILAAYKQSKMIIEDLERKNLSSSLAFKKNMKITEDIERAVALIIDDRIKKVIINRYIKGVSRSKTIELFNDRCDRTIDRKVLDGIISIANTFKLWKEET